MTQDSQLRAYCPSCNVAFPSILDGLMGNGIIDSNDESCPYCGHTAEMQNAMIATEGGVRKISEREGNTEAARLAFKLIVERLEAGEIRLEEAAIEAEKVLPGSAWVVRKWFSLSQEARLMLMASLISGAVSFANTGLNNYLAGADGTPVTISTPISGNTTGDINITFNIGVQSIEPNVSAMLPSRDEFGTYSTAFEHYIAERFSGPRVSPRPVPRPERNPRTPRSSRRPKPRP